MAGVKFTKRFKAVNARRRKRSTATGHYQRREGDEMACRCGKRWPAGEEHP